MSVVTSSVLLLTIFFLSSLHAEFPDYDDDLTRNVLWPIQVLTYGEDVSDPSLAECFRRKFGKWEYIAGSSRHCVAFSTNFKQDELCQHIVARNGRLQVVVVALAVVPQPGGFKNLTEGVLSDDAPITDNINGQFYGRMNRDILNTAQDEFYYSFAYDINLALSGHYDMGLWLIGHGAGAVLADVLGQYLVKGNYYVSQMFLNGLYNFHYLTTFGSPRPGDADYAAARERALLRSFRITQPNDRSLDKPGGFFSHHRTEVFWSSKNTLQIFYPEGSSEKTFKVCEGREDPACSAGYKGDSEENSNSKYFGLSIDDWKSVCK